MAHLLVRSDRFTDGSQGSSAPRAPTSLALVLSCPGAQAENPRRGHADWNRYVPRPGAHPCRRRLAVALGVLVPSVPLLGRTTDSGAGPWQEAGDALKEMSEAPRAR